MKDKREIPIYRRNPRMTMLILNAGLILIILIITEIGFRIAGSEPGFVLLSSNQYVALKGRVDTLKVYDYFTTDSLGIYKAKPGPLEYFPKIIINKDGFRGPDFEFKETDQKKVLFIGDSFTWGGNADPIDQCYVDLVRKAGYYCYNAGIPGAEPNQYALLAKTFIPKLKPDIVIVSFFMGNDIMYRNIDLVPYRNKYHLTNAGWLNPYVDGDWIGGPQETYDYYFRMYEIPYTDKDLINWACSQTVLGTKFWNILRGVNLLPNPIDSLVQARWEEKEANSFDYPISYDYLDEVQEISKEYGADFYLLHIPEVDKLDLRVEEEYPRLYRDIPHYFPVDLVKEDFHNWPDGHLNNPGHKKYADYIVSLIQQKGI